MARKIQVEEPSKKPPKPRLVKGHKVLREFGPITGGAKITSIPPCGPSVQGMKCVASWQIETPESDLMEWLEVREAYGNAVKLFHGTRSVNVASITTEGLRTGRRHCMFGSGIYFGQPEKAIGYAGAFGTHTEVSAHYVFEAEVVLGVSKLMSKAEDQSLRSLMREGYQSVHGRADYTMGHGQTLRRSEWVVYSPGQVLLDKLHEYQPRVLVSARPAQALGFCDVALSHKPPLDARNRAFKEVLSWKRCQAMAATQVNVRLGGKVHQVWVCPKCAEREKLQVGSYMHLFLGNYTAAQEGRVTGQK